MEDWDLLAVVRGRNNNMEFPISTSTTNNNTIITMESEINSSNCFFPLSVEDQDELFQTYPHLFQTNTAFDELQELYKPFYPSSSSSAATVFTAASSSLSSPSTSSVLTSLASLPQQPEIQPSPNPKLAKEPATKYKKRKSQLKRVVKEVKEEGLSSDMWAWRKYGQKPIKGSPYPRSYYRCSSSKGCSARKQVERSPSNPDIFIVTYTAEHTHAHPTRRNSLAGSTRSKFPTAVGPKLPSKSNNSAEDHITQDGIDESVKMDRDIDRKELLDHGDSAASTEIHDHMKNISVDLGDGNINGQLFASLDDLERGLEELDEESSKSGVFEGGFFDDQFNISDANWFIDHYNTTVTGAC